MNVLSKLYNYVQKFLRRSDNGADLCYDGKIMEINPLHRPQNIVYTEKSVKLYDWEKEDAKLRHPSNYRRDDNKKRRK